MKWIPVDGWVIMTPEIAAEILSTCNFDNRKLDLNKCAEYARDMIAGEWAENGEPIKFARNFRLMDGQHRLKAVMMAGVEVILYCVSGLEDVKKVFMSIDVGVRKSPGFLLNSAGRINGGSLATITKFLLCYESGGRGAAWRRPTVAERDHTIERYGESNLHEGLSAAKKCKVRHKASLAALYVLGKLSDAKLRTKNNPRFFGEMSGELPTAKGDAAFSLRSLFVNRSHSRSRFYDEEELALAIKAYNFSASGVPCKNLRWRTERWLEECFPNLVGLPWESGEG